MRDNLLTGVGEGRRRSQIVQWRESLVLFKYIKYSLRGHIFGDATMERESVVWNSRYSVFTTDCSADARQRWASSVKQLQQLQNS